ncbi:MAG: hypothetical protein PHC66_03975 [Candidatus Nanoarchaeia archaeon]|nr:hypothetical protein [Candidatus Nanoarchaeia archaeon]
MKKHKSTMDERIAEALKDAPRIKGMAIEELARPIDEFQNEPEWWHHTNKSYVASKARYVPLGRGKLYYLENDKPIKYKNA